MMIFMLPNGHLNTVVKRSGVREILVEVSVSASGYKVEVIPEPFS